MPKIFNYYIEEIFYNFLKKNHTLKKSKYFVNILKSLKFSLYLIIYSLWFFQQMNILGINTFRVIIVSYVSMCNFLENKK